MRGGRDEVAAVVLSVVDDDRDRTAACLHLFDPNAFKKRCVLRHRGSGQQAEPLALAAPCAPRAFALERIAVHKEPSVKKVSART